MKYIITESQEIRLRLLRRMNDVDEMLNYKMVACTKVYNICKISLSKFIDLITTMVGDEMYQNYFEDITSETEVKYLMDTIKTYIKEKHLEEIKSFYKKNCFEKKNGIYYFRGTES